MHKTFLERDTLNELAQAQPGKPRFDALHNWLEANRGRARRNNIYTITCLLCFDVKHCPTDATMTHIIANAYSADPYNMNGELFAREAPSPYSTLSRYDTDVPDNPLNAEYVYKLTRDELAWFYWQFKPYFYRGITWIIT
jgi:hypothetical protein